MCSPWRAALITEHPLRWGARPVGVAVDADAVWVTLAGTGELLRLSDAGATTTPVADPRAVAVADGVAYVTRFRSPDSGGITYRIDGVVIADVALAPDLGPDSDTDARGVPTLLGVVAVSPDGRGVVIGGAKAKVARGVQRDGLALTHETAARSALRLVDAGTGTQVARALFDNRDVVGAVAFTPLGDRLLVAHQGARVVDVLDPVTLARVGGFQDVGVGLDGIATDGVTAWVLASWDRALVVYDFAAGNGEIELARISLVDAEPLDPQLLLGARVFHDAGDPRMSRDAYLSCASCHPEGGQDARTWDFTDRGEGFRDTQALFALPTAGPFHWSANFDEIQDFENAIREHQAGTGFLSDADFAASEDPLGPAKAGLSAELDALAGYVGSFAPPRSPWREADGSPTVAGERGRAVFAAASCALPRGSRDDGCRLS